MSSGFCAIVNYDYIYKIVEENTPPTIECTASKHRQREPLYESQEELKWTEIIDRHSTDGHAES